MDVIVFTCDKHLWAVKPMAWLFNKYWSPDQRVIVVGYNTPDFDLPRNFAFYSVSTKEYPADKWVDAALEFFSDYTSEHFVLFHEDYWLTRKVDVGGVHELHKLCMGDRNILRLDLTGDRLYAGGMHDTGYWSRFDLVEAPQSQYQMSHQACIFNTELYTQVLKMLPGDAHSAWNVELQGTTIVNAQGNRMRVYGTRQWPVRYANGLLKGKLDMNELPKLEKEDYNSIAGWIPEHYKSGE